MYFQELISDSPLYRQKLDFEPTSSSVNIDLTHTEIFRSNIENIYSKFESDIKTLANVIKSQKKLIEYNSLYNAFLIDQISEEEFIKESENYTYSPQDIDSEVLLNKLTCLFKYTGCEFTSSELAEIFQCRQENIEESLRQLPNNSFTVATIT